VGALPGDRYALWDGTSGATPIVAGIVALVRAAHPDLDAANIINRVLATARPQTATTPDPLYGYGIIDAYAAVTASVSPVATNPLGTLEEWIVLYRRGEEQATVIDLEPLPTEADSAEVGVLKIPERVDRGVVETIPYLMVSVLAVSLSAGAVGALLKGNRSRAGSAELEHSIE
jgi:subtilisin family serine protease